MRLTDLQIRKEKSGERLRKLSDGRGLQLWIMPSGAKLWRVAYRFAGVQKLLALGAYPGMTLQAARNKCEAARQMLAEGVDPMAAKKAQKAAQVTAQANTFDNLAQELLSKKRAESKSESTIGKVEWLLGLASPFLGARPISEITPPEILTVLRSVEARGRIETANRLRANIGQVFRYAIATGRAASDPTQALRGAIATPTTIHRAAITDPKAFGGLLRAVAGYEGAPETRAALQLLALTFVRPGEMRLAEWAEFDLEGGLWTIPAGRMKMRRPHRIPLARQTLAILEELKAITGGGALLFPSVRSPSRCMSENTINAALRRLGYGKEEMSGHGFRSAASSMLNESGIWNPDAIESQLAHVEANTVRHAYQRAEFWDERIRMMTWWADRCDEMRRGGEIVQFQKSGGGAA